MGLLASIKDKLGDELGIFDDVQDFVDFAEKQAQKFERKARLAKKVIGTVEREIISADDLNDLGTDKIRQAKAVLRDTRQEMARMASRTSSIQSKAQRDKKLQKAVGSQLSRLADAQQKFVGKVRQAEASLVTLESDQRSIINRLNEDDDQAGKQRKLAQQAGRIVGVVAALGGIASVMARVLRVF